MVADSVYTFKRTTALKTSYILQSKRGRELPNFPAKYQRTPKNKSGSYPELKGKEYVNFRTMENKLNPLQKSKWEYCLSLANASFPVGLNFPNGTRRAAGDNRCMPSRNDCYLVEFSEDWNELTIYIFFGKGNETERLLRAWNAGASIGIGGE